MDYEVKLEIFEGPLDLLLHLIHKNEVDIFDIPIATITDQYLAYLDFMKALNINVAGDFLVMASTLVHIKSKMLLPEFQDNGEEEDPRAEITRPLLEYMHFKGIAEELSQREILERDVFVRPLSEDLLSTTRSAERELDVNLFQLMDAFKRIVDQKLPDARLTFRPERWTIKEKTEIILDALRTKASLYFRELFEQERTIGELVVTFLALLELVHVGLVRVFQPGHQSEIRLTLRGEVKGEEGVG